MDIKKLRDLAPWEWPDDTRDALLEVLIDVGAGEQERLLAAEMAGNFVVIDDALAGALLAVVGDASQTDELRSRAAIALGPALEAADTGEFDDPDEVPISERAFRTINRSLRDLYADAAVPREVRRRILEASVRAPQDWHRGAIRAAHASDDRKWKTTAVFCMGFVDGFEPQILEALKSDDPELKLEAVRAAGNQGVEKAWPHIRALLRSRRTNRNLLLVAIEAAGSMDDEEAMEILYELNESDDEEIAEAAEDALTFAGLDDDEEGEEDEFGDDDEGEDEEEED
jgi:hypothetical protein